MSGEIRGKLLTTKQCHCNTCTWKTGMAISGKPPPKPAFCPDVQDCSQPNGSAVCIPRASRSAYHGTSQLQVQDYFYITSQRENSFFLSSLAQFLNGLHSIERLSRAIPWTSSGIVCRSSLPLDLVISVISQLKGVC